MTIRFLRAPRPVRSARSFARSAVFSLALFLAPAVGLAADDRGFYVQGKVGSTDVEQSFGDAVEQLVDGDEDSWALEAGFRFRKYFGVQAGYHDFGSVPGILCEAAECREPGGAPIAVIESSTKAYSLAAVPRLPLPFGFAVFGKVGVVFFESEIDVIGDEGAGEFLDDFSDEDLILGLGASFNLPGPFYVLGEWEQIAGDIETISLGVGLSF
jgi:hypothetical protein